MTSYLCIKNYFDGYTFQLIFKKGETYQTSFRNDFSLSYIYIERKDVRYDVRFDEKNISKYFISMSEFREQQMKSILDD